MSCVAAERRERGSMGGERLSDAWVGVAVRPQSRLVARTAEDVEVAVHAQRPEVLRPHRERHLDRDLPRHGSEQQRTGCVLADSMQSSVPTRREELTED